MLQLHEVQIPSGDVTLNGNLAIPVDANGLVIFAHGSGSSRFSPRNRMVADEMHQHGLATLLFDLLTLEEAVSRQERALVFNIPLLTLRLISATCWARRNDSVRGLAIGLFGSSTGAAAALAAAVEMPEVRSVVCRGGRTDLAGDAVSQVTVPTLLIVGELDSPVIELNGQSLQELGGIKEMAIVKGASHLFSEPGTLERVAELAASWFELYLAAEPPSNPDPR
jgi:putative phosphoribosyl transferase